MKVISIINLKGGTGKTTTAVNMAYLLKQQGKRVLVIDNDKQSNATKLFLGKDFDADEENGLYEILIDNAKIKECVHKGKYDIDVIPSGNKLRIADVKLSQPVSYEIYFLLKNSLGEVMNDYDYVIIDNPPDTNVTVFNAVVASNDVIITVGSDGFGIDGAKQISELIESLNLSYDLGINLAGVLQTNVGRGKISILIRQTLEEMGYPLFKNYIRSSCRVLEANGTYKPIELQAPKCTAAEDYRSFLQEYLSLSE